MPTTKYVHKIPWRPSLVSDRGMGSASVVLYFVCSARDKRQPVQVLLMEKDDFWQPRTRRAEFIIHQVALVYLLMILWMEWVDSESEFA